MGGRSDKLLESIVMFVDVRGLGVSPHEFFSTGSLQYVCRCSWQLALQPIAGAQSHLSSYITIFARVQAWFEHSSGDMFTFFCVYKLEDSCLHPTEGRQPFRILSFEQVIV